MIIKNLICSINISELGKEGQQTDVLIHEATMGHHMIDDAKNKRHSTFTEAIKIARDMECKRAIFTHFSQRYSKVPLFEEFIVHEAKNTAVALDHTSVSMRTLDVIPETYKVLELTFGEEICELEDRRDNFKLSHFKNPFDSDETFETENKPTNVYKRPRIMEYK